MVAIAFVQVNAMEICTLMGFECKEGNISEDQISEAARKSFLGAADWHSISGSLIVDEDR